MHPVPDRVYRPETHLRERRVIQLPAIVLAHTSFFRKGKIKSTYLRACWYS